MSLVKIANNFPCLATKQVSSRYKGTIGWMSNTRCSDGDGCFDDDDDEYTDDDHDPKECRTKMRIVERMSFQTHPRIPYKIFFSFYFNIFLTAPFF